MLLYVSGNFDPDRHSPHHLKNFYLLPKRMSSDEEALWELLLEVSASHRSLHGMPPANAELLYITEAQHLEGTSTVRTSDIFSSPHMLLEASFKFRK